MKTMQFSPRESARHMALVLKEDVALIPNFATPKYPLPSIMHTEQQIEIMKKFAREGNCDDACLGVSQEELDDIVAKARVFRARILIRRLRRGEGSCADAQILSRLVTDGPVSLSDVHLEESSLQKLLGSCVM